MESDTEKNLQLPATRNEVRTASISTFSSEDNHNPKLPLKTPRTEVTLRYQKPLPNFPSTSTWKAPLQQTAQRYKPFDLGAYSKHTQRPTAASTFPSGNGQAPGTSGANVTGASIASFSSNATRFLRGCMISVSIEYHDERLVNLDRSVDLAFLADDYPESCVNDKTRLEMQRLLTEALLNRTDQRM